MILWANISKLTAAAKGFPVISLPDRFDQSNATKRPLPARVDVGVGMHTAAFPADHINHTDHFHRPDAHDHGKKPASQVPHSHGDQPGLWRPLRHNHYPATGPSVLSGS